MWSRRQRSFSAVEIFDLAGRDVGRADEKARGSRLIRQRVEVDELRERFAERRRVVDVGPARQREIVEPRREEMWISQQGCVLTQRRRQERAGDRDLSPEGLQRVERLQAPRRPRQENGGDRADGDSGDNIGRKIGVLVEAPRRAEFIRAKRAAPLQNQRRACVRHARLLPLDHDDFGSNRSKIMNVIDSNNLERDAGGKAPTLFLIPLSKLLRATICSRSAASASVTPRACGASIGDEPIDRLWKIRHAYMTGSPQSAR